MSLSRMFATQVLLIFFISSSLALPTTPLSSATRASNNTSSEERSADDSGRFVWWWKKLNFKNLNKTCCILIGMISHRREKLTAFLLSLFVGGLGVDWFYLRQFLLLWQLSFRPVGHLSATLSNPMPTNVLSLGSDLYILAGIIKLLLVGSITCCCSCDICGIKVRWNPGGTTFMFARRHWVASSGVSLAWPPSPGGWSTGPGESSPSRPPSPSQANSSWHSFQDPDRQLPWWRGSQSPSLVNLLPKDDQDIMSRHVSIIISSSQYYWMTKRVL